jgi:hypothetical protein
VVIELNSIIFDIGMVNIPILQGLGLHVYEQ